jgi:hypothetical protein
MIMLNFIGVILGDTIESLILKNKRDVTIFVILKTFISKLM